MISKNKKLFDWIGFFDFDVFLFINDSKTINSYIYNKKFQNCQSILFNWYFYYDNDLEKYDNRRILERFKRPKTIVGRVKTIIRGGIDNLLIVSSHIIGANINYFCNSNGTRVFPQTFYDIAIPENNKVYIKHFYTKSAQEFCYKIIKGDVQFHSKQPDYNNIMINKVHLFFTINKISMGKINILEECLNLDLIYFKNILNQTRN